MRPRTEYARSGDLHIAYQVLGEGPDLLWVPGWVSHVEHWWDHPRPASFIRRLATFARVILFDKRGTGMSDRHAGVPSLDERLDDMRAVLYAAGSDRPALLGISFEGAAIACVWAATHPERTSALVLYGATAKMLRSDDYPWGTPPEVFEVLAQALQDRWNDEAFAIDMLAPSHRDDAGLREWFARWGRISASPGAAMQLFRAVARIDIRDLLPGIQAPTLILHRSGDPTCAIESGRYVARSIPGARMVELEGADTAIFCGDVDPILGEIRGFLTGTHSVPESDHMLATILFTDIVSSTDLAARLGNQAWRALLEQYDILARTVVGRFGGRVVKSTGDGTLAVFDRPARALRSAFSLVSEVRALGVEIRSGVHTGLVERIGDDVGGLPVHIAARVLSRARPSEVLTSSAVADLIDDPEIELEDRGVHELKGVPEPWQLFAVSA